MNLDDFKPYPIDRFGGQVDYQDSTKVVNGCAIKAQNCRFTIDEVETRYGTESTMTLDGSSADVTGLDVLDVLGTSNPGELPIVFTEDGTLSQETPAGENVLSPLTPPFPLPSPARMLTSKAANSLHMAFTDGDKGLCPPLMLFGPTSDLLPIMQNPVGGPWTVDRYYQVGDLVLGSGLASGRWFRCTVPGIAGSVEPSWPSSDGYLDGTTWSLAVASDPNGASQWEEWTPATATQLPTPVVPTVVSVGGGSIAKDLDVYVRVSFIDGFGGETAWALATKYTTLIANDKLNVQWRVSGLGGPPVPHWLASIPGATSVRGMVFPPLNCMNVYVAAVAKNAAAPTQFASLGSFPLSASVPISSIPAATGITAKVSNTTGFGAPTFFGETGLRYAILIRKNVTSSKSPVDPGSVFSVQFTNNSPSPVVMVPPGASWNKQNVVALTTLNSTPAGPFFYLTTDDPATSVSDTLASIVNDGTTTTAVLKTTSGGAVPAFTPGEHVKVTGSLRPKTSSAIVSISNNGSKTTAVVSGVTGPAFTPGEQIAVAAVSPTLTHANISSISNNGNVSTATIVPVGSNSLAVGQKVNVSGVSTTGASISIITLTYAAGVMTANANGASLFAAGQSITVSGASLSTVGTSPDFRNSGTITTCTFGSVARGPFKVGERITITGSQGFYTTGGNPDTQRDVGPINGYFDGTFTIASVNGNTVTWGQSKIVNSFGSSGSGAVITPINGTFTLTSVSSGILKWNQTVSGPTQGSGGTISRSGVSFNGTFTLTSVSGNTIQWAQVTGSSYSATGGTLVTSPPSFNGSFILSTVVGNTLTWPQAMGPYSGTKGTLNDNSPHVSLDGTFVLATVTGATLTWPQVISGGVTGPPNLAQISDVPLLRMQELSSEPAIAFNFDDNALSNGADVTNILTNLPPLFASDLFFIPTLQAMVYVDNDSYPGAFVFADLNDPGSLPGSSGDENNPGSAILSVGDGAASKAVCIREMVNGGIVATKSNGGYQIIPSDGYPSQWSIQRIWHDVGPCTADACVLGQLSSPNDIEKQGFISFWDRETGPYIYVAGNLEWLGREIQGTLKRVNRDALNTAWAAVDEQAFELKFGIPLDGADTPNYEFTVSFLGGWGFPEIVNRYGKLITTRESRKWSVNPYSARCAKAVQRTLANTPDTRLQKRQFVYGRPALDGQARVAMIVPDQYDDDGDGIDWQYQPWLTQDGMNILTFGGYRCQLLGSGQIQVIPVTDDPAEVFPPTIMTLSGSVAQHFERGMRMMSEHGSLVFSNLAKPGAWGAIHDLIMYALPKFAGRRGT